MGNPASPAVAYCLLPSKLSAYPAALPSPMGGMSNVSPSRAAGPPSEPGACCGPLQAASSSASAHSPHSADTRPRPPRLQRRAGQDPRGGLPEAAVRVLLEVALGEGGRRRAPARVSGLDRERHGLLGQRAPRVSPQVARQEARGPLGIVVLAQR